MRMRLKMRLHNYASVYHVPRPARRRNSVEIPEYGKMTWPSEKKKTSQPEF